MYSREGRHFPWDSPGSYGLLQLAGPGTDPEVQGDRAERAVKSKSIREKPIKTEKGPFFHQFMIKKG